MTTKYPIFNAEIEGNSYPTTILLFVLLGLWCGTTQAVPVGQSDAHKTVTSWLTKDARTFGTRLGKPAENVKTFNDEQGQPIYHVVYLQPGGFVIVSAEDGVEPIISFVPEGIYDPSESNPLGALVSRDMQNRVHTVRAFQKKSKSDPSEKYITKHDSIVRMAENKAIEKWKTLLAEDNAASERKASLGSISDIRVTPLLQTKWGQETVNGNACFNYYTPPNGNGSTGNYPCGCVATAMAQYMRFWQYPTTGVGNGGFTIYVDNSARTEYLRGGNGSGGAYNWSQMPLVPNSSTTLTQRQAIGALTYDAGVAIGTDYALDGSGAYMSDVVDALIDTFGYSNAIFGFKNTDNIGNAINAMINPNLDYGNPVILSIGGGDIGHTIVADGYGYSGATLYHHLNMGWNGSDDVWYNLPDIDSSPSFDVVDCAIYNIYTSGSGEIISGRVMDTDTPISGATVIATRAGGVAYQDATNAKGIYAIAKVPSNTAYTVTVVKSGYSFDSRVISTGYSEQAVSGNRWGIDFTRVESQTQITKCTVTAGKYDNSDRITFSGTMNAIANDLSISSNIEITIASEDLVNPCVLTFPINIDTFKKGVYNYTLKEDPLQSLFKFNTKNEAFSFSAKNTDLTGLSCPITVTIEIGSYVTETTLDEITVNGSRPCPLPLLQSIRDTLTVTKSSVKRGKNSNPDSLTISGTFTIAGSYSTINPLEITLGSLTFTVPGNQFLSKNGVESCKMAASLEGPLVTAKLDYNKCTFTLSIKNVEISESGEVNFGLNYFGVNLEGLETINLN